jgi:hypothetical protein
MAVKRNDYNAYFDELDFTEDDYKGIDDLILRFADRTTSPTNSRASSVEPTLIPPEYSKISIEIPCSPEQKQKQQHPQSSEPQQDAEMINRVKHNARSILSRSPPSILNSHHFQSLRRSIGHKMLQDPPHRDEEDSLLEMFRPRGRLSVTDLVGPSWCEVKFDYSLRGMHVPSLLSQFIIFVFGLVG